MFGFDGFGRRLGLWVVVIVVRIGKSRSKNDHLSVYRNRLVLLMGRMSLCSRTEPGWSMGVYIGYQSRASQSEWVGTNRRAADPERDGGWAKIDK